MMHTHTALITLASLLASLALAPRACGDQASLLDSLSNPFWAEFANEPATNASARIFDDDDCDGLPNGIETFLAANYPSFQLSPTNAFSLSPHVGDYFTKTAQLYLGGIFTDHDFIEDWYEDSAQDCSRYSYDLYSDPDGDGWSAFQTCRAARYRAGYGCAPLARPEPAVSLTLHYTGQQPVAGAPVVLHTFSDAMLLSPDAVFVATNADDIAHAPFNVSFPPPISGWIHGGNNTFIAFIDLNGDSQYSTGEPMGFAPNVDVGWFSASAVITLTDTSPVVTRCDFSDWSTDREQIWGTEQADWTNLYAGVASGGRYERVRVIRTLVDGFNIQKLAITDRVIFDKTINLATRPYISEADVLHEGCGDIDWDYFASDVLGKMPDPTEATYRIVIGNGPITGNATNNLFRIAPTRRFDAVNARTRPVIQEPGPLNSVVHGARPIFKWTMKTENPRVPGLWTDDDGYPAFKLQVRQDGNVVYDSGTRLAPARDRDGVYSFVPDAYVGDLLEPDINYTWRVSMYNAKFRDDAWSAGGNNTFRMATPTNTSSAVKISVKYFGPANVLAKGRVRIEAFETPDFSGDPVARTCLSTNLHFSVINNAPRSANAFLVGLNPGKYYVRGYIDMNTTTNGTYGTSRKKDAWESWGYVCNRDGSSADSFSPKPINFDPMSDNSVIFDLYIEDADTNGNNLPDAWEMVQNGGSLDYGSDNIDKILLTPIGTIPTNQKLSGL